MEVPSCEVDLSPSDCGFQVAPPAQDFPIPRRQRVERREARKEPVQTARVQKQTPMLSSREDRV